jgi:L-fuculose-phosphate aldolase
MPTRAELASQIVRASHALHHNGWAANHDGNLSVRLAPGRYLVTPTATSKRDVTEGGLAVVGDDGKPIEGDARPPSEFALHLGCFAERPDVGAVIHAHPPYATALACAGQSLTTFLAEAVVSLGPTIPLTTFALPFGAAGAAPIRALIDRHDALLLCRHGVITVGKDLETALLRMELVEHLAKIATLAVPHGGVRPLPVEALRTLIEKRRGASLGLAADRTTLPEDPDEPDGPAIVSSASSAPASSTSWTPTGPPPAPDSWSGGRSEGACGVVYGAPGVGERNEELISAVQSAIDTHLAGNHR